ncbi:hypothetical protein K474DRAFT_1594709 [Panus rudis PR-1116 ss-1]|nr:hypothetical protein K474DRAFT_1594709 [Panus rudis PR-1116 ss-1]
MGSHQRTCFNALLLPAGKCQPARIVPLHTSDPSTPIPSTIDCYLRCGRVPHPEVYMCGVPQKVTKPHVRVWHFEVCSSLENNLMLIESASLECAYIIFYPVVSNQGHGSFPVNEWIRRQQGERFDETEAWRGDIIIAKYGDHNFSSMGDISSVDYPAIRSFFAKTMGKYLTCDFALFIDLYGRLYCYWPEISV